MYSKGMVEGILDCSYEVYLSEHYVYDKHHPMSFPSRATRAKGILELMHSDVFRLMLVLSLGGSQSYVSFIDDFSIITWFYFMRKKYEVFETFKEFKTLVENETDKKIKVLRTYSEGEFFGKSFNQFYR